MRRRTVVGMLAAGALLGLTGIGTAAPAVASPTAAAVTPADIGGGYFELNNPSTRKCADVLNEDTSAGAIVQQWDCKGIDSQQWALGTVDVNTLTYTLVNRHSGLCLDLAAAGGANGTRIVQMPCLGQTTAQWRVLPAIFVPQQIDELKNVATGKCLDLLTANSVNGNTIRLWDCSVNSMGVPSAPQEWVFEFAAKHSTTSDYEIFNPRTLKCADVKDESTSVGAVVQEWDCKGIDAQQWSWNTLPNGAVSLVNRHSGQCLDLTSASGANGTRVVQRPCAGQTSAQWRRVGDFNFPYFSFALQNVATAKCLDLADDDPANGTPIQTWDCGGATPSQIWTME